MCAVDGHVSVPCFRAVHRTRHARVSSPVERQHRRKLGQRSFALVCSDRSDTDHVERELTRVQAECRHHPKMVYGYTIQDDDDPFVRNADRALRNFSKASTPGWIVDVVPSRACSCACCA